MSNNVEYQLSLGLDFFYPEFFVRHISPSAVTQFVLFQSCKIHSACKKEVRQNRYKNLFCFTSCFAASIHYSLFTIRYSLTIQYNKLLVLTKLYLCYIVNLRGRIGDFYEKIIFIFVWTSYFFVHFYFYFLYSFCIYF